MSPEIKSNSSAETPPPTDTPLSSSSMAAGYPNPGDAGFVLSAEVSSTENRESAPSDDEFSDYFIDPEGTGAIREWDSLPPIDPAAMNAWWRGLEPSRQQELDAARLSIQAQREAKTAVHDKLARTVPELYRARLPEHLAARLGNAPYALGFNQSGASSIAEAQGYLEEKGGIDVTDHAYDQRFMIYDGSMDLDGGARQSIVSAVDSGYYRTSSMGRFVVAFPAVNAGAGQLHELAETVNRDTSILPADFKVVSSREDGAEQEAVSPKYIAGFIDDEGTFWQNTSFAILDVADFRPIREQTAAPALSPDEIASLGRYGVGGVKADEWL